MRLRCCAALLILLSSPCYALEKIEDFTDNSLPVLNEEMKRIDDKINNKIRDIGDSTAVDFTEADLTTDGTWYDLDLSSVIPKGAKWVILAVEVKDNAAASELLFRKNGYYNDKNVGRIATQVANISTYSDIIVQVDKDGKIEYKGSNLAFTAINITVKGTMK